MSVRLRLLSIFIFLSTLNFVFNLYAQSPSFSNDLGRVLHNAKSQSPCWDLTEEEFKKIAPQCGINRRPLIGNYKYIFSQLVLQKAGDMYNSRQQCFESSLNNLSNPNSEVAKYFKTNALSALSYYYYSKGRKARLEKKRYEIAQFSLNDSKKIGLSNSEKISPKEVSELLKEYDQEIAEEANKQEQYLGALSFADDEKVREIFLEWGKDNLDIKSPSNYPTEPKEIEALLEKKWAISNPSKKVDQQLRLYAKPQDRDSGEFKNFLQTSGLTAEALQEILKENGQIPKSLEAKIKSCVASEFGDQYAQIENIKNLSLNVMYFAAGASVATRASKAMLLMSAAKFNFWIGGLTGLFSLTAHQDIEKDCLSKIDPKKIEISAQCSKDGAGHLDQFIIEKNKYNSCLLSLSQAVGL